MKASNEGQEDQSLEQILSLSSEGFYKAHAYYAKTQLQPEAVNRATGEDINKWLHERAIDEVNRLVTFVSWLIQTAQYLHDDPILVTSREREEDIVSPQDYANEQKEIASYLANLPRFTARVRIADDTQTHEHTIHTLAPQQGIGKTALYQRMLTIHRQNKADGYIRERRVVEAEIFQRQQRYQLGNQTPLQNCQQCGATYRPGAKFCNKCGGKVSTWRSSQKSDHNNG